MRLGIPMNRMYLYTYDADLNLMRLVVSARDDMIEELEHILSRPEKRRNERSVELKADLFKNEDVIRVTKQSDPEAGEKSAFTGAINIH